MGVGVGLDVCTVSVGLESALEVDFGLACLYLAVVVVVVDELLLLLLLFLSLLLCGSPPVVVWLFVLALTSALVLTSADDAWFSRLF